MDEKTILQACFEQTHLRARSKIKRILLEILIAEISLQVRDMYPSLELLLTNLSLDKIEEYTDLLTPFFEKKLKSFIYDENEQKDLHTLGWITLYCWDTFFSYLPDATQINIKGIRDKYEVSLPILGIELLLSDDFTLIKQGNKTFIRSQKDEVKICFNNSNKWSKLDNNQIILANTNFIVGTQETQKSFPLNFSGQLDDLKKQLERSIGFIEENDSTFYRLLNAQIKYYVALENNDASVHKSYSDSNLPGCIFLSLANSTYALAEAIVHEFYHNELNFLLEVSPLFLDDKKAIYYSPLRKDPRPLYGLFHAVYVLSGIAQFITRGILKHENQHGLIATKQRKYLLRIINQLEVGYAQINQSLVAEDGKEILQKIKLSIYAINKILDNKRKCMDEMLLIHTTDWKKNNPGLSVNMPEWWS